MKKELEAPLPSKPFWAADFPIDRVEAQHVSRREFAKYLLVVSGGLAGGSAWVPCVTSCSRIRQSPRSI